MNDILGVFRPVFLDFPRMLPHNVLIPQFVGEKTADFSITLSLQSPFPVHHSDLTEGKVTETFKASVEKC